MFNFLLNQEWPEQEENKKNSDHFKRMSSKVKETSFSSTERVTLFANVLQLSYLQSKGLRTIQRGSKYEQNDEWTERSKINALPLVSQMSFANCLNINTDRNKQENSFAPQETQVQSLVCF